MMTLGLYPGDQSCSSYFYDSRDCYFGGSSGGKYWRRRFVLVHWIRSGRVTTEERKREKLREGKMEQVEELYCLRGC